MAPATLSRAFGRLSSPRHKASRVACASLVYMLSPIPRRGGWDHRFCSCSPNRVSLPRKRGRVGPRIVLFEACSAFTRVTACTLAASPYFVTRWSPEASTVSLPPQLLRLLPAGAFRRVGLSPTGKRRLSTAHPQSGHSDTPPQERLLLASLVGSSRMGLRLHLAGDAPNSRLKARVNA
jgi:hypothetical protein